MVGWEYGMKKTREAKDKLVRHSISINHAGKVMDGWEKYTTAKLPVFSV